MCQIQIGKFYITLMQRENKRIYFDYFKDKNESISNKGGAL